MEDQNAKELHEPEFSPDPNNEPALEAEDEGEELTATDRILYVVTSPKRAFQGLQRAPLGSVIGLGILAGVILFMASILVMFSSEKFVDNLKAEQVKKMEEAMERPGINAEAKEQMEEQIETIQNTPATVYMLFGTIIPAIFMVAILCLVALVILMLAKIFERGHETRITYGQSLAVASLAGVVSSLGGLIMAVIALVLKKPELSNGWGALVKTDSTVVTTLLAAFGPQYIWWYVVTGLGIASLARTSAAKAILAFAGVVILVMIILGMIGEALKGVFG